MLDRFGRALASYKVSGAISAPFGQATCAPIEEESSKVGEIFERFEDRSFQPLAEVDRFFGVVVEGQVNSKTATVLSSYDRW